MRHQLFTANGLAEEFGIDRRFVALRLGGVRPDGQIGNRDGYLLATFFQAVMAPDKKPSHALKGNGAADEPGDTTYVNARARLLASKAAIAEMERKRLAGELVPVIEIEPTMLALANAIKTRLLLIPSKVAARIALMRHPAEVETLLRDEVDEALSELSRLPVEVAACDEAR